MSHPRLGQASRLSAPGGIGRRPDRKGPTCCLRPFPVACPPPLAIALLTLATACLASPWTDLLRESQQRTGLQPALHPSPQAVASEVAQLLADGLTRDEAVQIALLNNAALQAAFEELGIAQADLRQAGLYTNPSLDVLVRYPEPHASTNVEMELGFSISDLWRVPLRRRVAQAQAQRATMIAVAEILNTVADARRAHDQCLLLQALRNQTDGIVSAARQWRDHVHERYAYGYSTDLDVANADAALAQWELDSQLAASRATIALARLRRVLGLLPEQPLQPTGPWPPPAPVCPSADKLIAHALQTRPDVQAARLGLVAARDTLALQRRSRWKEVTLGPAFAHDTDGQDLWGARLTVELPLFDTNRAARERAAYTVARVDNELAALEARVREQVTVAVEELNLASARERLLREQVLPARQRAYDYASKYGLEMQINMLYVYDAQKQLYSAQRDYISAVGDIQSALVELEFAVGGKLP